MKRGLVLALAALALTAGSASGQAGSTSRIVFAADRAPLLCGEIYRLDPNGHRVDLSRDLAAQDTDPVVSSDGEHVAFISNRSHQERVYEVSIDGRGLVRVGPGQPNLEPASRAIAWQPHGDALAVVGSSGAWIVRPRHKAVALAELGGGPNVASPAPWSPDGRVLLLTEAQSTLAVSPSGRVLWTAPPNQLGAAWSAGGLVALMTWGRRASMVRVYDEQGRLRFRLRLPVPSPVPQWSPDGKELALVSGETIMIVTPTGRVVRRAQAPTSDQVSPALPVSWAGNSRLAIEYTGTCGCRTSGLDVRTGTFSSASKRWLDPLSSGRRRAIVTSRAGSSFTLGVGSPGGGPTESYGRVTGCRQDGVWLPAVTSLQFAGRSVVYQTNCTEPPSYLYSVGPGGSELHRIAGVAPWATDPAISPDGSQVAYTWAPATGMSCNGCTTELRASTIDGRDVRTLTTLPGCTSGTVPAWSPDGATILYTAQSGCDATPELYTIGAKGGTPYHLGISGYDPAWGPTRIAYVGSDQSDLGLWTSNPDGGDRVLVDRHGVMPAWSPDGRLAYLAGSFYKPILVVGSRRVGLPFSDVTSLAWSPDGTRLVLTASATRIGDPDVYTIKPDGTDPVRLTRNYDATGAAWR